MSETNSISTAGLVVEMVADISNEVSSSRWTWPDNPLRRDRLAQLVNQTNTYVNEGTRLYGQVDDLLSKLNDQIRKTYRAKGFRDPETVKTTVNIDEFQKTYELVKPIGRIGTIFAATKFIEPVIARYTGGVGGRMGQIAARVLISRWGITVGTVARWLASTGIAIVLAIALEEAIEAVVGRIERDQLVNGIRGFLPVRANALLAFRALQTLYIAADAVENYIANSSSQSLSQQQFQDGLDQLLKKYETKISALSLDLAYAELVTVDHETKSYRAEDVEITSDRGWTVFRNGYSLVIDVWNSSDARGQRLLGFSLHWKNNQRWELIFSERYKALQLKSRASGKVVNLAGGSHSEGANIIQWDDGDIGNQTWALTPADIDGRHFYIVNLETGTVIGCEGDNANSPINSATWLVGQKARALKGQIWHFA